MWLRKECQWSEWNSSCPFLDSITFLWSENIPWASVEKLFILQGSFENLQTMCLQKTYTGHQKTLSFQRKFILYQAIKTKITINILAKIYVEINCKFFFFCCCRILMYAIPVVSISFATTDILVQTVNTQHFVIVNLKQLHVSVLGKWPTCCTITWYRVVQKERMFFNLSAISFFGVTSNQKSTFENLVQSTIWKFPFAKKLQLCHKKC